MAVSRAMAIGTMVVFLLIIFLCAMLFWASRSARVHPFLISINNMTGEWSVVGHDHGRKTLNAMRALQESIVGNFARNWFAISDMPDVNNALWKTCNRVSDCGVGNYADADNMQKCALYCISGDDVFARFLYDTVPDYQMRVSAGERWVVDMTTMNIIPVGDFNDNGGTWRVMATVVSNVAAPMQVIAYAKVERNISLYPRTLGYYVQDFNAYKLN